MKKRNEKEFRAAHAAPEPAEKETRREKKIKEQPIEQAPAVDEAEKKAKKAQKKKSASKFWLKVKICVVVLLVLAAAGFAGVTYAGYYVTNSATNFPNVYIGEINVGGLTRDESVQLLKAQGWDARAAEKFVVTLPRGISQTILMSESGIVMMSEDAADNAFAYGHTGSFTDWYDNLLKYVKGYFDPVDTARDENNINSGYIYSKLDAAIAEFNKQMTVDEEYTVDEETAELHLLKGANQVAVDREVLYEAVVTAMENGENSYDCTINSEGLKAPDFKSIYETLAVEPIDAYYDYDAKEIVASVDGFRFDVDAAMKIWEEADTCTEITIPVEIIEPEVTTESLENTLFVDILGKMTTSFASSSDNRINNLELACSKIDGIILNPGEIFSYNDTLGQRTEEAGFLPAGAYADGEVVEEVGGGICQVSSTLYAATLYARMHTVERTNHYFAVAYMDKGIDATVSWPKPNFRFQNNSEYPIMIRVWFDRYDTKSLTIAIMGTDVNHYTCNLWHESFTHTEDYEYDGNIYPGVNTAIVTCTWRDVYDQDGNFLFREPVNVDADGDVYYDYYFFHKEDIIAKLPKLPSSSGESGGGSGESSGEGGSIIVE